MKQVEILPDVRKRGRAAAITGERRQVGAGDYGAHLAQCLWPQPGRADGPARRQWGFGLAGGQGLDLSGMA